MIKREWALALAGVSLALASGQACSMGFGRTVSRAVLGEPLRVSVPLLLEAGESLDATCISAEVYDGDNLVSRAKVQLSLSSDGVRGTSVQVRTASAIIEPVTTLYLSVGCRFNVKRSLVLLADPPSWPVKDEAEPVPERMPESVPEQRGHLAVVAEPLVSSPRVLRRADAQSALTQAKSSKPPVQRQASAESLPVVSSRTSLSLTPRGAVPAPSRLVLDPVEADASVRPDLRMSSSITPLASDADQVTPALQERRAAAAALWQAMNLTPEEIARDRQKLLAQERVLAQLQNEAAPPAPAIPAVVVSPVASDPSGSTHWSWVAYAVGAAALAGVWLSSRFMRQLRHRSAAETDWRPSHLDDGVSDMPSPSDVLIEESLIPQQWPIQKEGDDPSGFGTSLPSSVASTAPELKSRLQPEQGADPALHTRKSESLVAPRMISTLPRHGGIEPMREVSVEELIDLEQQADFFVVLGQDDAAIELLESHIVSATASPLLFLKLLEIYQRLGKHEDYERIQATFNQRFNGHAPAWGSDLQHGHELADYPEVIERLQALWPSPFKAMEVLERSLSRPESHADTFDLPAYRELLLLYSVARDLSEREVDVRPRVDLFEPVPTGHARIEEAKLPVLEAVVDPSLAEPLMATRPVKAVPDVQPTLSLDLQLDELTSTSKPTSGAVIEEMEHIDLPGLSSEQGRATQSDHKP